MKRTRIKLFACLALAALVAGCSSLEKMKKGATGVTYTVTPEVLEAHAGKVDVNIKVQIPAGYFDKKAVVVATPVLVSATGETAFPSYSVQGEKAAGNAQVVSRTTGGQVNYTNSVAYNENMRVSDLVVRIKATKGSKSVDFEPYKIAEGVISTSGMVAVQGIRGSMGKDQFQRITEKAKSAEILFLIQQATLRNTELTKEEVKALNTFINEANAAENQELKGADISAYASPDGALDLNTKLAAQRETAAKGFLADVLKKSKVDASSADFYNLKNTPEDWEGFKSMMEKSTIQDKDLILRVLSMYNDPEVREKEIKNMAATYKVIADEILPKLRRSKVNINVVETGKSDAELSALASSDPSKLSLEELLFSATLTKDVDQQVAIYKAAAAQYPTCWRAHNNVGYALYQKGDLDGAKVAFEKANSVKANQPEVMNNLGVIALRKGDMAKADEYFGAAAGAGSELDNNLGVVAIYKGMYDEAVRYFGNSTSCNAALAKILAKNYDAALSTLNANTMEVGLKYYLKAIVGVRTADADLMFANLRKAVELDSNYKKAASTDMEFSKYFGDATFRSIVQ